MERRFLGVLMLDTAFPRVVGDAGNPESYPFDVRIQRVAGAGSLDIVRPDGLRPDLTEGFIAAAQALEHAGAVALISTCGFLVHAQDQIAQAVKIPVVVSALSLYPTLKVSMGTAPIGVVTASRASLETGALAAARIDPDEVLLLGMEDCPAFTSAILAEKSKQPDHLDGVAIEAYLVARARALVAAHPELGCILLECGNLPPYASAIAKATGRPVFSILDVARMLWAGSDPQSF